MSEYKCIICGNMADDGMTHPRFKILVNGNDRKTLRINICDTCYGNAFVYSDKYGYSFVPRPDGNYFRYEDLNDIDYADFSPKNVNIVKGGWRHA